VALAVHGFHPQASEATTPTGWRRRPASILYARPPKSAPPHGGFMRAGPIETRRVLTAAFAAPAMTVNSLAS
jgi:hypothetical protein